MVKNEVRNKTKYFEQTDHFMKQLWSTVVRDFRSSDLLDASFCQEEELLLKTNIKSFRGHDWKRGFLSPNYYFKAKYQMESLLKRYRFADDMYSDDELKRMAEAKFLETQVRIGQKTEVPHRTRLVIDRARIIIAEILGDYDPEEHWNQCRLGKRASVGNPFRDSNLDRKMGGPLTGSRDHISWFDQRLAEDPILQSAISGCVPMAFPRYEECDALTLTCVPKSWKALRCIIPNTFLGVFYTSGLGKMIQKRLCRIGLNIKVLQDRHRELVKKFSKTRSHVTADLSSASDSFTEWLVKLLVPDCWFQALNLGRISKVKIGADEIQAQSFMTMGIGFTFTLQTLLFYGLLKAIEALSGITGCISVFGDDLIYPTKMHHIVRGVFGDLNFILNDDKTFVKENFRESCGEDCYYGISVRPFQPKGSSEGLSKMEYQMLLYKTINGLARRWDEVELPITFRWLYTEILRTSDRILQVPESFPDYSGVKVSWPRREFYIPWSEVGHNRNGSVTFSYLGLSRNSRPVVWQLPFYWDKLRQDQDDLEPDNPFEDSGEEVIRWVRVNCKPYRSSSGRWLKHHLRAVVDKKGSKCSGVCQTGTTIAWS